MGLGHLYFTPMGVAGFLLAGFWGWVLAKSMVETRGFAWTWLIRLPLEVLSFASLALA